MPFEVLGELFGHGSMVSLSAGKPGISVSTLRGKGPADPEHFTYRRGYEVSEEAANAAWAYRIPANSIIYFAVDFDVLDEQIVPKILPYFQALHENLGNWGLSGYRVGIYAPGLFARGLQMQGMRSHRSCLTCRRHSAGIKATCCLRTGHLIKFTSWMWAAVRVSFESTEMSFLGVTLDSGISLRKSELETTP
ncbi:DUF1906 domain-containing protein [Leucobacter coleopterorum]|uniref:DUF1906 domain-containing protein n=1 Tax=Leucobacter coleopterorum TaxID=2714933 RepID=A0ABX6K2S3_9MICO|nr:DUF1906 domain-containing protein [Leucobacter coleopterorum]